MSAAKPELIYLIRSGTRFAKEAGSFWGLGSDGQRSERLTTVQAR